MPKSTEHDTFCQMCGIAISAGTLQRFWLGARPRCVPCDERALEAFGRYKLRSIEHNERVRQAKDLDSRHSDYAWEGGALGQTKQCDNCEDPYPADRYRWFGINRDLCGACEDMALYDFVNDHTYRFVKDNPEPWVWKGRLPGA